jgi:hypothetical protein
LLTLKTTKEIARLPYPLLKPENEWLANGRSK